jgi:hypothetical protein
MSVLSEKIRDFLGEINPEALVADGYDEAIIGTVRRFSDGPLVLYDYNQCLAILMRDQGMSCEEAEEWMEFNVLGAWVGPGTPCYAVVGDPEQAMNFPNGKSYEVPATLDLEGDLEEEPKVTVREEELSSIPDATLVFTGHGSPWVVSFLRCTNEDPVEIHLERAGRTLVFALRED